MSNNEDKQHHKPTEEMPDEFSSRKHSVKHKQIERKIRKKRKKISRLKALARFVVLLCVVFLSYKFVKLPQWYLPQDTFTRKDGKVVQVINNNIVSTPVIYDSLKNLYVPKLPIFAVKVYPIKHELYKIPVIKKVYIRRYGFPARIQIIVKERIPMVVIKNNLNSKPIAFFTTDEVLVTNPKYMDKAESDSTLRLLTNSRKLGSDWNAEKILNIEKIARSVETYSGEKVSYVDLRNPNDVYVKIQTTNIRLGALDSTVFDRIKRIYTILPQIQNVDSRIKYIDLSWDKVNYLKLNNPKNITEPKDNKETKESE